jgi:hypothetical protein
MKLSLLSLIAVAGLAACLAERQAAAQTAITYRYACSRAVNGDRTVAT